MHDGGQHSVLIVLDDLGGGTGNHLLGVMSHWDAATWRAAIYSYARRTARIVPDIPIEFAPALRGISIFPINQIKRLLQLRACVRRRHPQILHTYFFWPIMYGRVLKRLGLVDRLIENREDQGFAWGRLEYALLRLSRSMPDHVVCVSAAVRAVVLAREGLQPERVSVIHNGVAPAEPRRDGLAELRRELGVGEANLIVGMVANFNRAVKGASNLLRAAPDVVRAVPEARFVLLGRGKEEGALRALAAELGVAEYVVFAGYREDIDRCYALMDVSVLTSHSEGLSITLLESMNMGLPVVVTAVGGNPEVVIDGVTGFLVPPGDTAAFADKLVTLLRDAALRSRMGEAGRRRVEANFRLEAAAGKYLVLYRAALQ